MLFLFACRYKRLPIYDNTSQSLSVYLDGCVTFIKEGHCHGKVLVHCAQGVSRSASVVLAFLMAELKMGLDEALAHCRRARPQVKPNDTFMQQLKEYGRKFKRARCAPIGPVVFEMGPAVALGAPEAAASTSAGAALLSPAPALCEECETHAVELRCLACSVWYCQRCCDAVHDTSLLDHVCTFMPVARVAAAVEDADVPAADKRRKLVSDKTGDD
jgi:hypothetical protein